MKLLARLIVAVTLLLSILLSGCSSTNQQEVMSTIMDAIDTPEVQSIRNMTTEEGIKLGDLFEAGMSSVTYELYDPAEDGNTYVTVKGNVLYNNVPVVVGIQYKKVTETEYEFYTLVTNDIPVKEVEIKEFFDYFKEEYNKSKAAAVIIPEATNNDSNTAGEKEPGDSEVDTTNDNFTVDKDILLNIISLTKRDIIDLYGEDCETKYSGAEGSQQGYYYENLGITIIYDENDTVSYIDFNEKVNINGAAVGMTLSQIQEILGETEIEETWVETPDNKIFILNYSIDGYIVDYYSFDQEGTVAYATIYN